ncbi:hypothetical protein [Streptomyces sp. MS1.AVA.4]|uniref:Uncharacterized protein n=1 Tax=Streptomyces pratisoli TaxID=3139917 RepID=A0ACC6QB99_9ACTN
MPERSTPVPLTHLSITAGARVKERLAQAARSPEALAEHVRGQLIDLLQLQGCRFEYGRLIGHPPRLEQNGDVVVGRRHWNVERHGWPDGEIALRATANGRYLGRFMLRPTPGVVAPLQARLVAVTLADQAGAALDTAGPLLDA